MGYTATKKYTATLECDQCGKTEVLETDHDPEYETPEPWAWLMVPMPPNDIDGRSVLVCSEQCAVAISWTAARAAYQRMRTPVPA